MMAGDVVKSFASITTSTSQITVRVASRLGSRMKGLLGTEDIEPMSGLLLSGKQVHTFGMRFPIDVVHFDREGTVLSVLTLPPRRVSPLLLRSRWILEMREGEAASLGMSVGTSCRISFTESRQ